LFVILSCVLQDAAHFDVGEFVDVIYVNRMRTSDDKQFVLQLFEKVKFLEFNS